MTIKNHIEMLPEMTCTSSCDRKVNLNQPMLDVFSTSLVKITLVWAIYMYDIRACFHNKKCICTKYV